MDNIVCNESGYLDSFFIIHRDTSKLFSNKNKSYWYSSVQKSFLSTSLKKKPTMTIWRPCIFQLPCRDEKFRVSILISQQQKLIHSSETPTSLTGSRISEFLLLFYFLLCFYQRLRFHGKGNEPGFYDSKQSKRGYIDPVREK